MIKDMREAFERWYSNDGEYPQPIGKDDYGNYHLASTDTAWSAWQDAWTAALEWQAKQQRAQDAMRRNFQTVGEDK